MKRRIGSTARLAGKAVGSTTKAKLEEFGFYRIFSSCGCARKTCALERWKKSGKEGWGRGSVHHDPLHR